MAADVFGLQALFVNDEASFLENGNSFGSNTYDTRLPFESATVSLEQGRVSDMTVQGRKNESRAGYLGLRTGTIEWTGYVPGIMTDPGANAPTTNYYHDLLEDALGGGLATDDGGTISSATDGDTFVTTGVTTITPGSIIRVGVKGDGRCDGQPGAVSTWSAGNTQLLTALPGTPNASDAVRACLNHYPTEANPTVTKRFLVLHATSGAYYQLLGCQMEQISFEIPIADGGPIKYTARYRCAYWDQAAASSPATLTAALSTALPACDTAVIAGGSLFKQTFATTTRAIIQPASLTLTLDMPLIAEQGPAASQPNYTNIFGWVRQRVVPTLTYTQPWLSSERTDFDTDGNSTVYKHFLFAANAQAGRTWGFYLPRAYPVGSRPTVTNVNGLLYQTVSYQGAESTTTTSELTRSVIRFFQG